MLLLLIITLCLALCEGRAKDVNETVILKMHHKNFREIKTILKKVNEKLQDIGQLMQANKEVATLPVIPPPALRNGITEKQMKDTSIGFSQPNKTKPNPLEKRDNSLTTSFITTVSNTTSSSHATSVKLKPKKISGNTERSEAKTTSVTVVSTVKNSSSTLLTTHVSETTASHVTKTTVKSSVPVLREMTAKSIQKTILREDNQKQVSDPDVSSESQSRTELINNYYRLLEEYDEGYLVIFLMELSRLVAVKDVEDVQIILKHMDPILLEMLKSKKLGWFGYPITHVMLKFGLFVSDGPIQLVRNYSGMVYYMIRLRNTSLDSDINSIIDYADILYEDAEGRLLFEALGDFEAYPNVSKTSTEVCQGLIDSFFAPYRRLLESEGRQNLLDAINYVLRTRFPRRRSYNVDIIPFIKNGSNNIFEHHIKKNDFKIEDKFASLRSKNKYSNKEDKDYLLTRTREKQTKHRINVKKKTTEDSKKTTKDQDISALTLASHFQTTSSKPQFEKDHETEKTRRSSDSREETDNKVVRSGYFHQKNGMKETKDQSILRQVRPHLSRSKLFRPNDKKKKCKQKILKQIVEGSSYSDEEESLQKNLIEALQRSNKVEHYKHVGTATSKKTSGTVSSQKQYRDLTKQSGVKFKNYISLIRAGYLR